jgi:hypothetical protein
LKEFDWAYFRRLNLAIAITVLMSVPAFILLSPLAAAILLASIAWFFPDLDRRFRLNDPSYLNRFSELERHRHDERNKKITRISFILLALGQMSRALSGNAVPVGIPWHVTVFVAVTGFVLINSVEFLRYRLSLSATTYEELYINHMTWSRLLMTPLLLGMFAGVFWIARR